MFKNRTLQVKVVKDVQVPSDEDCSAHPDVHGGEVLAEAVGEAAERIIESGLRAVLIYMAADTARQILVNNFK